MRRSFARFARTPIVGGNWKMNAGNGITLETVDALVDGLNAAPAPKCEVFCAPPTLYLAHVNATLKNGFVTSAQNCYKTTKGAFTGETSPEMLVDAGVPWTLIGHSERRDVFGETDELLGEKIAHAQSTGLGVVACCGEHKEAREAGTTMDVLIPQLQAIASSTSDWSKMVIAYEPVWAIGTGLTATTEQAQGTCADIRSWLAENVSAEVADAIRIQYGGSVNDGNAAELAQAPDVDGFLIGGASLKADAFATCYGVFK
tara:strand:+ start:671 stop:1447 length:777 start_codon:yes stop_codon:yes gene_type:complete